MRSPRLLVVALLGIVSLTLLACGSSNNDAGSAETIDITMTDNAFTPPQASVPKGATVTLRFTNDGTVRHEAILGSETEQDAHHEAMSSTPMSGDMDMGHDSGSGDKDAIVVEPGQTGSMTTTFTESGAVLIGCHEPGHWEDGMKATINVR